MNDLRIRPILVTGSHRSGSTWVGRMISLSPSIGYIREPFNLYHRPGVCSARFDCWFPYICNENASTYLTDIKNCIEFRYRLKNEIAAIRTVRDVARLVRDWPYFLLNRAFKKRALLRDPIALFSAPWLAETFNMDVVVLLRHPAAFAGSLKKVGWKHPFDHFLKQHLLMKHHLQEFESRIGSIINSGADIIDQAILLWNIIHYMILKFKGDYPNWIFVRHEDLSMNPVSSFSEIFRKIEVNYTNSIQNQLTKFSTEKKTNKIRYLGHIMRNSHSNIKSWFHRLSDDEISRIREGTLEISEMFYTEDDWKNSGAGSY